MTSQLCPSSIVGLAATAAPPPGRAATTAADVWLRVSADSRQVARTWWEQAAFRARLPRRVDDIAWIRI
ncbi:MAG TPA: hypothetical protein VIJ07_15855 [Dermatophilaceae bacterium]